ncbi:MAG: guanylate kinase [Oscillospiraceae bacterium]|nr:guanylate kinase [Oscillospiraceae bacterium]
MENKGVLFVVSAPAGCGKDTILNEFFKRTDTAGYAVSATTRAMREGEINGVHYHFLTVEDFKEKIESGEVLEYTEYCGNFYGTLKKSVGDLLSQGKDAVLKIEVEGAMNIRRKFPDACLVFILPPSLEVLEKRLRGRGTETEEKIMERTAQAKTELKFAENYDYIIVNDDLNVAVEDLLGVFRAEKLRKPRRESVLKSIMGEEN